MHNKKKKKQRGKVGIAKSLHVAFEHLDVNHAMQHTNDGLL